MKVKVAPVMIFFTNGRRSLVAKSPPQTKMRVPVLYGMMMQRNRAILAVKVAAKKLKMTMAMALWLRVAQLGLIQPLNRVIMSRPMSVMVPPILVKIIMEMAGHLLNSAKIIISRTPVLHQ